MKYCKKCLEPSTRPTTVFDKYGVCYSCLSFENLQKEFDENKRYEVLEKILKQNSKTKYTKFDCVIGVSGGKDSLRQATWIRDKLNLRPLLVCGAFPPEQLTDVGAQNLSNLIDLGFDLVVSTPSPQFWKKAMKRGFFQGNYLRGPEIFLYSSQVQIAIKNKIKLIFLGENPSSIWNDTKTKLKEKYDGNAIRYSNTLKDCDLNWMKDLSKDKSKLIPYTYPSVQEFKKNKLQIVYLGWFWNNWSVMNNAKVASTYGLYSRKDHVKNTGDLYGIMALDEDWVILNQMIKYYKFGHGRVTDYLNAEIRYGKISREEAITIVDRYDGSCHEKYVKSFCSYLNISENQFWNTVDKFVNKNLFTLNNNKYGPKYIKKFKVGSGI